MPGARDIRAGGAYVELSARDGAFLRGLARAQGQLRAFASSCASIGSSLLAVSGAALGVMGMAANSFATFDDAMRSVAAVTGATGEQFDALTARARALGAATRYTAEVVANTLNMFGLAAEQSGRAADVLTATANGSAQTLSDLFEALRMVGPQAKAAGYSLEETSAAIGVLANVGLKGSMAGNALKRALQQFADPGVQKRLGEIGVQVRTAEGELRALPEIFRDLAVAMNALPGADRLALAKDVFDVRASGAGLNLAANVDALDAFLAKLRDVDGAASKTEAAMNAGIGGALAALKSAAQDVALAVGDALAPSLRALADEWRGSLNAVSEWVARNKEAIVTVAKTVAYVAAFGAAMFVLGKAVAAVTAALSVLKAVWIFLSGIPALVASVKAFAIGLKGLAASMWYARSAAVSLQASLAVIAVAAGAAFLAVRAFAGAAYEEQDAARKALEAEKGRAQADNDRLARLQQLAAQQSRSAAEMEEADAIARQLNSTYGAQIATVDRLARTSSPRSSAARWSSARRPRWPSWRRTTARWAATPARRGRVSTTRGASFRPASAPRRSRVCWRRTPPSSRPCSRRCSSSAPRSRRPRRPRAWRRPAPPTPPRAARARAWRTPRRSASRSPTWPRPRRRRAAPGSPTCSAASRTWSGPATRTSTPRRP